MKIEVILFDLGGVLVELTGVPTMLSWSRLTEAEVWQRWLHSPAVRRFESGNGSAEEFAREIIDELTLNTTTDEFLTQFTAWPRGVFSGGIELLQELGRNHQVACLSNTNHLHWDRFEQETELLDHFHAAFASHQTGHLKPDASSFEHAIDALGVVAENILFMDDNQINIDAAQAAGLVAKLARGVGQATEHVRSYRLLD